VLGKDLCVTENDEAVLGPGESDVQSTGVVEETDA
jgi:hypothetical protein